MGWRSDLEKQHTVSCYGCGHEALDYDRRPRQRYIRHAKCPSCGKVHPSDRHSAISVEKGNTIRSISPPREGWPACVREERKEPT